jgi:hypothetical protein
MLISLPRLALFSVLGLLFATTGRTEATVFYATAASAEVTAGNTYQNAGATDLRDGRTSNGHVTSVNSIFVFDLSSFAGANLSAATFSLNVSGNTSSIPTSTGFDLYGVGYGTSATFPSTADFNDSGTDSNATLLQNNLFTGGASQTGTFSTSAAALLTYLSNRGSNNFVFLRVSQDADTSNSSFVSITLTNANNSLRPTLDLTDPPSTPAPAAVVLVVSAFPVLGLGAYLRRRKPQPAA